MTNADRIRNLNDVVLADVLANDGCPYSVFGEEDRPCEHKDCDICWLRWLKEESKEVSLCDKELAVNGLKMAHDYDGAAFVERLPEIEEVVHCRECKFWAIDQDGERFCSGAMAYTNTPEDWYCAGGKYREASSNKWEVVKGVLTPGGDPYLICPVCHDEASGHMGGIENPKHWNYCPVCGAELEE